MPRRKKSYMKLLRFQCPRCLGRLEMTVFETHACCEFCGEELELRPAFLATFSGKVLFLSGALLLGIALSQALNERGFAEDWASRALIDLAVAAAYYFACRLAYSLFQHAAPAAPQRRRNRGAV
jgi:hypothetical protein